MEAKDKLKELNMTADEIDRLTEALKDEKFREIIHQYAQELSDPENKKRYEEEIKLLEQERGNYLEFIHPEPFKALRTSVNGKQKCFINICSNDKVGKPEGKWGVSEEGRRGHSWSLPHFLHPGRQVMDPKGNKIMIYDVVFHPDTLHIASNNKRFMDMVDNTAIQAVQQTFNVTLDKNNMRQMSTKYKGTPQPCVLRKPIPGYKTKYKTKEPSEEPDPLAFPYPDEKRPTASPKTETPATKSSDAKPETFSIQPQKAKEPTKPNYTVKYRSFVDPQDFRCSRDSAQSPRPKEIVVTIDVPLLKAAADASLEVKERWLLLESKKPAYRLELPLAYPVDEEKGEAKFNTQRGQLTVTLPVLPSREAVGFALGLAQTSVSDDERQEEQEEKEREGKKSEEEEQTRVERGEEGEEDQEDVVEEEREKETWRKQKREGENSEEGSEKEIGNIDQQKMQRHEDKKDSGVTSLQRDVPADEENSSPAENSLVASPETESQPVLITTEHLSVKEEEGDSCLEPNMHNSDIREETEKTRESVQGDEKVEPKHLNTSSDESQTSIDANIHSQSYTKDCSVSQESDKPPAADDESSRGGSGSSVFSEELPTGSVKLQETENVDEDDLPTEQIIFNNAEHELPPVLLREIDEDGKEKLITDHSTSAGFIFQNSLMFELD